MQHQTEIPRSIMNQQVRCSLPKKSIDKFDGNPGNKNTWDYIGTILGLNIGALLGSMIGTILKFTPFSQGSQYRYPMLGQYWLPMSGHIL